MFKIKNFIIIELVIVALYLVINSLHVFLWIDNFCHLPFPPECYTTNINCYGEDSCSALIGFLTNWALLAGFSLYLLAFVVNKIVKYFRKNKPQTQPIK